jgi:uncharacterized membrane protein (UPF0127 family)
LQLSRLYLFLEEPGDLSMRSRVHLLCAALCVMNAPRLSANASPADPPKDAQPPVSQPASSTPPKQDTGAAPAEGTKSAAPPSEGKDGTVPATKPATVPGPNDILHAGPQKDLPRRTFTLFGESFDCELCLEPAARDIGMAARTEFPKGTAMIFVHPRPRMLNYWMKDCLIDMDIVMVDRNGVISALHEAVRERLRTKDESLESYQARLPLYGTPTPAKYVIEVPPGTIARLKPKVGQRIDIDWKSLDAAAK